MPTGLRTDCKVTVLDRTGAVWLALARFHHQWDTRGVLSPVVLPSWIAWARGAWIRCLVPEEEGIMWERGWSDGVSLLAAFALERSR